MNIKEKTIDCGIIVGRFQLAELHNGHLELIQGVVDKHERVVLFLGVSPVLATQRNPLDFESRKQMILDKFPNVTVLYIKDIKSDELWSEKLDEQIADIISPTQTLALYGSRDSFINHYKGKYQTIELENEVYYSATDERRKTRIIR